jgi:thioredoxin
MRSDGFKEVYELSGGIMKWRGANLPETTDKAVGSNGMSKQQFDALLSSDKLVLIDFYADWCGRCKVVAPILEELSNEFPDVLIYKVNTEIEQELSAVFQIRSIPSMLFIPVDRQPMMQAGALPKSALIEIIEKELR